MANDPKLPEDYKKPKEDEENTYNEWVQSLTCKCPGGGVLMPSPPPGIANLGDIIADLQRQLNVFASQYGLIIAIIQIIMCIIDVICAIANPFALIKAIIKLFGVCLPELILILPQFAVLAYLICMIKILIAIVTYILTVIVPLITDIVQNITDLKDAISENNADAIAAVAYKLTSLFKELLNLVGILAPLEAVIKIIETLLALAIGLPCDDDDPCCEESVCPDVLKEYYLDGYDGNLGVYYTSGSTFDMAFTAPSKITELRTLEDFFPKDADLANLTSTDDAPYVLNIPKDSSNEYIVTDINNGVLSVAEVKPTSYFDGYLSSVYNVGGITAPVDGSGRKVRFGSASASFSSSDVDGYVSIFDPLNFTNIGTWQITTVYDANNVELDGLTAGAWTASASLNPAAKTLLWFKLNSAPTIQILQPFKLDFNHAILMKYGLIGAGCHPAIRATKAATYSRFPTTALPALPDITGAIATINECVEPISDVTADDIIADPDGYGAAAVAASACISNALNALNTDMQDFAKEVCPGLIDYENSPFTAAPEVQLVGSNILATVTPWDLYGGIIGQGLPSGTLTVEIFSTIGEVSSVTELTDDDGVPTGVYTANVISQVKGSGKLSAKIDNKLLNTFNGTSLETRYVDVKFVEIADHVGDDSMEPLGNGAIND